MLATSVLPLATHCVVGQSSFLVCMRILMHFKPLACSQKFFKIYGVHVSTLLCCSFFLSRKKWQLSGTCVRAEPVLISLGKLMKLVSSNTLLFKKTQTKTEYLAPLPLTYQLLFILLI